MAKHNVADIRNIALVGHGAVGKTTMADLMLFKTGLNTRAGSVDDGSSLLDVDDEEKNRKSSITSALCHFEHAGKYFNVIDTPGYPDFLGQVLGPLAAVETAVIVIDASSGIQVNTRRTFNRSGQAGIARMFAINKCDADNLNLPELVGHLQATFGQACVPVNVPVGSGKDFSGVISALAIPEDVPEGALMDPAEIRPTIIDAVAESDDDLMTKYLEEGSLSADEIRAAAPKAMAAGTLIPIVFTSSKKDIGVAELFSVLSRVAPSPEQLPRSAKDAEGKVTEISADPNGPISAFVFKTRIDPFVARMSFVRVFSGTLKKDTSIYRNGQGKAVRLGQPFLVQGGKTEAVDSASAGDIVAVVKMDELSVGDTLTEVEGQGVFPAIPFPTPMIGLAAEPKSRADQTKISSALSKIEDEDQTFRVVRNEQTHEMVIQGLSELHLQIILERLHSRDKVEVVTHQPKVPYRETVKGDFEGSYRHKKQSGGSGQFAEVHMRISACPHDIDPEEYFTKANFESMRSYHYDPELNFAFVDRISGGSIPNQFIPAVEKGVRERMIKGVLAGFQVQDVVCELFFGKDHPVDSNETAFKMAGSLCFRDIFGKAKPALLEPIVNIEITVPEEKLGDITSDLNTRRGRVEGMDGAPGGFQIIHAKAPLAEVMTYARSLSSMTGGQGSFTMELSHYDLVPPNVQSKVVEEAAHAAAGDD